MKGVDVETSLEYFPAHGGYCDGEIVFNGAARANDDSGVTYV
jgi:hypothetical protein